MRSSFSRDSLTTNPLNHLCHLIYSACSMVMLLAGQYHCDYCAFFFFFFFSTNHTMLTILINLHSRWVGSALSDEKAVRGERYLSSPSYYFLFHLRTLKIMLSPVWPQLNLISRFVFVFYVYLALLLNALLLPLFSHLPHHDLTLLPPRLILRVCIIGLPLLTHNHTHRLIVIKSWWFVWCWKKSKGKKSIRNSSAAPSERVKRLWWELTFARGKQKMGGGGGGRGWRGEEGNKQKLLHLLGGL